MDQSKLLQIINKDLAELKELTDELVQSDSISKIEIEIALSKSKLVFQEFELLKEKALKENAEIQLEQAEPIEKVEKEATADIAEPEKIEPIQVSDNGNSKEPGVELKETTTQEADIIVEEQDAVEEEIQKDIVEEETVQEEIVDTDEEYLIEETGQTIENKGTKEPSFQLDANLEGDDINIEEDEEEPNIVVGETFAKGKSLNDALSESQTIDQKFASSPISKLEPAIGLNDRFLFIRELFEGDSDKFSEAVDDIDNFNDLKEAVDYLSTNYKWKKTETSLKFVELVKRRFQS